MSDKTFSFLNKYYTYSKKYFPFVCLALFLVIAFCKVSTIICISVYFGLMVAHLIVLGIISHFIKNYIYNALKEESSELIGELENDTKESN